MVSQEMFVLVALDQITVDQFGYNWELTEDVSGTIRGGILANSSWYNNANITNFILANY